MSTKTTEKKIGEKQHALLGPSSASRWLACTPSARLEEQFPDTTSEAAEEGTVAHALAENWLRYEMREITGAQFKRELRKLKKSTYYNAEMEEYVMDYVVFVLEELAKARVETKDAKLEIEVKLDLTEWVPGGFGTGDAVIIADGTLQLIDLKYGKGVKVDSTENKQTMLYGLGALNKYSFLYSLSNIKMTIFQPRMDNFSSYEMTTKELIDWAEIELKPKAELAWEGKGEFVVGPHCQFCKAKAVCKAYARHQLEIDKYKLNSPDLLTDDEVADVLERAKDLQSWIKAVQDFALNASVETGRKWPGFKLVEGRANRKILEEDKAIEILKQAGFSDNEILTIKLQGITALEKLLGKKGFSEKLGDLVVKPEGSPTLVPDYDKRPELNSAQSAADDFKNININ